jgi:hypothetical protein
MRSRYLTVGAAIWAAAYAGIYVAIVSGQGNPPAWWYLALLAIGAGSLAAAAAGLAPRPVLIAGTACLALAALAGVASIGLLLVPAVAAATVAAAGPSQRRQSGQAAR